MDQKAAANNYRLVHNIIASARCSVSRVFI